MSEPTDEELFDALHRGKLAVRELVLLAEQRARLAGWEECREACLAAIDDEGNVVLGSMIWTRKKLRAATAALTPPTKEKPC